MGGWLWSEDTGTLLEFLFFVVVLGGFFGMATGRAIAGTWKPMLTVIPALLFLAAAVRFLLYALAGDDLFSPYYYIVALIVVAIGGFYGFRSFRAEQMCRQYPWLFTRAGPLDWTDGGAE